VNRPDEAGPEFDRAKADRESRIRAALLRQVAESGQFTLTDAETQMSAAERATLWVQDEQPTETGLAKLNKLGLNPGSDDWARLENTLMQRNVIGEPALYGANLDKGQVVAAGQRFNLTADTSPSRRVEPGVGDRAVRRPGRGQDGTGADHRNGQLPRQQKPRKRHQLGGCHRGRR
jgi:hypothetical protein